MLVYPSGLDVSSSTLRFLSDQLRAHRRRIGCRWRRLRPGRQALLVLAHLRNGHPFAQLAAGFRIGLATAHRYVKEAVDLLAGLAPTLEQAIASAAGMPYVVLDGTLLPIDRIAEDRPFYSGKHKRHGVNVQVLADPLGRLLWASPAKPGAVHDIRAAREHGIITALTSAGIACWADKGYQGAGGTVRVPFRGRWETLSTNKQEANRSHARIRGIGEMANATLKNWRLLRKIRSCPSRATALVQAVLTLHQARSKG